MDGLMVCRQNCSYILIYHTIIAYAVQ